MKTSASTTEEAFAVFNETLSAAGLRGALAYLLSLTNYCFIAIFRFEDGRANAAVFYDRANPQKCLLRKKCLRPQPIAASPETHEASSWPPTPSRTHD